jgi:hypothetical protein
MAKPLIYVEGASATFGDELDNPQQQSWPSILKDLVNCDVINNASKGKSNQHMIFDTVNFCSQNKPDLVIITFGPLNRYFFVRRDNNYCVDMSINGSNSIYDQESDTKTFKNLFFKYWTNYLYTIWAFLQGIVSLQAFLQSQNIKYIFLNSDDMSDIQQLLTISTQPVKIKRYLLDAFDALDDAQILEIETQLNSLMTLVDTSYDINWHFNKIIGFFVHPSAEQHVVLAHHIHSLLPKFNV